MEGGFGRLSFFPLDHRTRRQRKGPRRRTGRASCPLPVHPRSGDFLGLPEPVPQDPGSRLIEPTIGVGLVCQSGGFSVVLPRRSRRRRRDLTAERRIIRRMPLSDVELVGRFVGVVYDMTSGQPGQFRRIDDCPKRAGIKQRADLAQAVATAEAPGLLVVHVGEQLVMLTSKGRDAARG
jgi:hypothetical protein